MRTIVLLIPLLLLAGCQPYVQAQMDLVEQARRGVELARASQEQSRGAIEQLHDIQRKQLDDAFDADVRGRGSLDIPWIIAHRKAYALGLDALARERQAAENAHAAALRNLAATDAALEQFAWLQSLQLKWLRIHRTTNEGDQP